MKRLICIVFFLTVLTCKVNAQSASPSVLNATGNTVALKTMTLSWSVGEMAVATLSAGNNTLTEGFLQPDVTSISGIEEIMVSNTIICFPNPARNQLYIRQNADVIGSIYIYNVLGERIYAQIFTDGNIDLSPYKPGMYFVNICNKKGDEVHTFKILKF